MSRSTWACELKLHLFSRTKNIFSHAPRERVSWNDTIFKHFYIFISHAPRERVSWNVLMPCQQNKFQVTLHVSVWVEIYQCFVVSRSLKSRSTWACELKWFLRSVEFGALLSRSTWACELKCVLGSSRLNSASHAPRERVSWNSPFREIAHYFVRHAPRERVSWNTYRILWNRNTKVTLHVSVWVEISHQHSAVIAK